DLRRLRQRRPDPAGGIVRSISDRQRPADVDRRGAAHALLAGGRRQELSRGGGARAAVVADVRGGQRPRLRCWRRDEHRCGAAVPGDAEPPSARARERRCRDSGDPHRREAKAARVLRAVGLVRRRPVRGLEVTRSRARFTITVAQPFRAARAADGRPEGLRYGAAAVSVTRAVSRAAAAIVTAASLLIVSRTVTTVAAAHPPIPEFHTSDRCIACHNGLMTPSGEDVSIGYDWRASMMANSSRDPYWQASVRRETMDHPESKAPIEDECSICHMPIVLYEAKLR